MTEEIYKSKGNTSWSWRSPGEPFKGQRWCQPCFQNCNINGTKKGWNPRYKSVEEMRENKAVKKRMDEVASIKGAAIEPATEPIKPVQLFKKDSLASLLDT
jgi:hypothetical protein